MINDRIKALLDRVDELIENGENNRRIQLWKEAPTYSRDKFRHPSRNQNAINNKIPIVADPGPTMFAKIYGFSVKDYYTKPMVYLEHYLQNAIDLFHMGEDTFLTRTIPIYFGTSFDASFFGIDTIYHDDDYPWMGHRTPMKKKDMLDSLEIPVFEKDGLGALGVYFYNELSEILKDSGFTVAPPELLRGPFALAFHVRGFENFAIDCMTDPGFVHKLIRYLTDAHKDWYVQRKKVLGSPIGKGLLYNDEVDCNVIGPNLYKEYALPYEQELSEFHGGISYWHSCGNINLMLPYIKQIANIDLLNVSAWTNYETAASSCPNIPLEFCLKPTSDVYTASEDHIFHKINEVRNICKRNDVQSFYINTGSLQQYNSDINNDFDIIKAWIKRAQETVK
ncbi:MAG: hypothetical protein APF76_08970 [Desulfitibacter sp. BRH_c19]|nr:MAG: hypothetical protein APF76_08970 [Desulfitibacter sp. BRH_c19]